MLWVWALPFMVLFNRLALGSNIANKWLAARLLGDDALDRQEWGQVYQLLTNGENEGEEISTKASDVVAILGLLGDSINLGLDDDQEGNFFLLNSKRYENRDDLYYLKTSELRSQMAIADTKILLENEIVIGEEDSAPLIVFYGCENDDDFQDFNENLFEEARMGKIRIVWRPTCLNHEQDIGAYSASFKDDSWGKEVDMWLDIPDGLSVPSPYKASYLPEISLRDLDLKLTTLFMKYYINNEQNFDDFITYCRKVLDNFPILSASIASMSMNISGTEEHIKTLHQSGITSDLIGLFINGQLWRLSQLDEVSLSLAISKEWSRMTSLSALLKKYEISVSQDAVLNAFSRESLDTLHNNQPNRYDFHRIPGFSESVIYFNDIEKDDQYQQLSMKLTTFFTKSEFGEIPAYKENWNELVFVINFDNLSENEDTQESLQGLLRAIDVVSKGYPQRIGLLPLVKKEGNKIVDTIYHLKKGPGSVNSIVDYLSDLGKELNFDIKNEKHEILDLHCYFGIHETSLLVNGIIVPFKKNSWHYMVSKIVKHDVTYVKDELKKYSPDSNISIRNILHYNSLTRRSPEYIPENFEDSTFTRMKNEVLIKHMDRVVEYKFDGKLNTIHTVSLVGDYNSETLLEVARNLLQITYLGIRFRFVHTGELTGTWQRTRALLKTGVGQTLSKMYLGTGFAGEVFHFLKSWLPDLTANEMTTPFVIVNGRVFNINSVIDTDLWENILRHDAKRSLDLISSLQHLGSIDILARIDSDLVEELTAALSQLFFHSTAIFHDGLSYTTETVLPRINIDEKIDDFNYLSSSAEKLPINLTLIIDPIEERSQRLLYLVDNVRFLPFLNIKILLLPTKELKINPIHRLYDVDEDMSFDFLDFRTEYPGSFADEGKDLLVIAHAFDEHSDISKSQIQGISGVCLELEDLDGNFYSRSLSMEMFGYTQLRIPHFAHGLKIKSCDPAFEVVSFSTDARANYIPMTEFTITNNIPVNVYVKLRKNNVELVGLKKETTLNILLSVEDGQTAEAIKFMKIIDAKSKKKPMFFLLTDEEFSGDFHPDGIHFEVLKYNWPLWLRPQRFRERELKAKKFLFLDTMIPNTVTQLVYLRLGDTSFPINNLPQVAPHSVFALQKCEMSEESYWNHGYWRSFLDKNKLPFYNASDSFIINMEEFRHSKAGDKLRLHYQRLSQDIASLRNIDFDLLNNMQLEINMSEFRLTTHPEFFQDEL